MRQVLLAWGEGKGARTAAKEPWLQHVQSMFLSIQTVPSLVVRLHRFPSVFILRTSLSSCRSTSSPLPIAFPPRPFFLYPLNIECWVKVSKIKAPYPRQRKVDVSSLKDVYDYIFSPQSISRKKRKMLPRRTTKISANEEERPHAWLAHASPLPSRTCHPPVYYLSAPSFPNKMKHRHG